MSLDTLKVKIIQKAWQDPAFKARLLADPRSALQESLGIAIPEGVQLQAVEETPSSYYLVIPPNPADLESSDGTSAPEYNWS